MCESVIKREKEEKLQNREKIIKKKRRKRERIEAKKLLVGVKKGIAERSRNTQEIRKTQM